MKNTVLDAVASVELSMLLCCCGDRATSVFGNLVPTETLLGRWRLTTDLFGRVFSDDVGAEPGSVISELGGFAVKESKFRREMERLRNSQQRDLTLEVRWCCEIFYMTSQNRAKRDFGLRRRQRPKTLQQCYLVVRLAADRRVRFD